MSLLNQFSFNPTKNSGSVIRAKMVQGG